MGVEYRYIDIIFLDNCIMNFILLWVTLKLAKGKSALWRMIISAITGGGYAVLICLPRYEMLMLLPFKFCLSILLILIAYDLREFKEFLRVFMFFYMITFVFGGAAFGLYYFYEGFGVIENGVFYIENFPLRILAISTLAVMVISKFLWSFIKLKLTRQELLYNISVFFGDESIFTKALLDTGNVLFDPLSNSPVVVIEYEAMKDILPIEIRQIFENSLEDKLDNMVEHISHSPWMERFRLIPYMALGKTNGLLIGFKPDNVKVFIDDSWVETDSAIVGVYNNTLSKTEGYHALMNPEIIS